MYKYILILVIAGTWLFFMVRQDNQKFQDEIAQQTKQQALAKASCQSFYPGSRPSAINGDRTAECYLYRGSSGQYIGKVRF